MGPMGSLQRWVGGCSAMDFQAPRMEIHEAPMPEVGIFCLVSGKGLEDGLPRSSPFKDFIPGIIPGSSHASRKVYIYIV